jgi:dihydroorotate dehydrogenase (fumarate)
MADLTISYMGLTLKNPVVVGASQMTSNLPLMQKIEDAGAGAIVCKSLFEEQVRLKDLKLQKELHENENLYAEMTTIFPQFKHTGPKEHLYWLKKTKETLSIPVIASLNAVHEDTWLEYAKQIEGTGVDGLELNLYATPGIHQEHGETIEKNQIGLIKRIKNAITIPISVKLSPFYTNTARFIRQLDAAGVDGFVLFNRFFQSDIDIHKEESTFPFTYSRKEDNRISLRYAGLLHGTVRGTLCCNTGIMDSEDVIKMILAGADAVQVVSTLYKNGISHVSSIINGIAAWMKEKKYGSIDDFKGKMSRKNLEDKDGWIYQRTQYVKILMQSGEKLMKQII